jgi:hypothetical protein
MKIDAGFQAILRFGSEILEAIIIVVLLKEGFMNYTFKMRSGVMIYIPNLIKIGLGIEKLTGEDTYTDTQTAR